MNPHQFTRDFEAELCRYTGAPYVVAVNSCTMALLLAVAWWKKACWLDGNKHRCFIGTRGIEVEIPKRTYVSVPMSIIHGGGWPKFRDENWLGAYQLNPLPVWDSARYFSGGMYRTARQYISPTAWVERNCAGQMVCVSFHWTKTLGVEFDQGGAILHDSPEADAWFRRARFDGRTEGVPPKDDRFDMLGWHCYMNPTTSKRLLKLLQFLPKHNDPLPNDTYPDLSTMRIFQ